MPERTPHEPRVVSLEDPVELMVLAAGTNPFIAASAILDRQVVASDIGLVVGGSPEQPTCLFLWVTPLRDLGAWMGHAARWLSLYPHWRRLQGLSPSAAPVKIILAGPEVRDEVRSAARLLSLPVVVARYTCLGYGPSRRLYWEDWDEEYAVQSQNRPIHRAQNDTEPVAAMTAEEVAFFTRR